MNNTETELLNLSRRLTIADLPGDGLQWVAEIIGVDNAIKLLLELKGQPVYFRLDAYRKLLKIFCCVNYNGSNADRLASRLGVSLRTIHRWLNEPQPARLRKQDYVQEDALEQAGISIKKRG